MTYTPVIPVSGLIGLRLLDRTYQAQFDAFSRSPDVQRDIDYFLEHAGEATTAEDLVGDRRLLKVALGAFGLDDEIDHQAFVRKILEEGTLDSKSLANRLSDPAWAEFSRALGYGDVGGLLVLGSMREEIAAQYQERQFERAVGDVDVDLRLAMNFRRQIKDIATSDSVGTAGWFKIMGSESLRAVVVGAFGLPDAFAQIDIDRQSKMLAARAEKMFGDGSPAVFASEANVETLIRRFLVTQQMENGPLPGTPGMAALIMLQSNGLGSSASANLFASNL